MSRELPYFRWYPADAESDYSYSSFSAMELGVFHRALNYSWTNDGLPADDAALARSLRLTVRELRDGWTKVRDCFPICEDGRRRNNRQEQERSHATKKSRLAAEATAHRESKKIIGRSSDDHRTIIGDSISNVGFDHPRTRARADSGSDSSFGFEFESKKEIFLAADSIFPDWWQTWSAVRGTHHSREALQAWLSVVPMRLESAALECTVSYLASLDNPAKGFNPHTFLFDQAKEMFQARWPAFAARTAVKESRADRIARMVEERRAG